MEIEFDSAKRNKTLLERGLDFAKAAEVFGGVANTIVDRRENYGEPRYITTGLLSGRLVVIVWTPRGANRRIISMRKANEREQLEFSNVVGRP